MCGAGLSGPRTARKACRWRTQPSLYPTTLLEMSSELRSQDTGHLLLICPMSEARMLARCSKVLFKALCQYVCGSSPSSGKRFWEQLNCHPSCKTGAAPTALQWYSRGPALASSPPTLSCNPLSQHVPFACERAVHDPPGSDHPPAYGQRLFLHQRREFSAPQEWPWERTGSSRTALGMNGHRASPAPAL